jgi:hypothetical protein
MNSGMSGIGVSGRHRLRSGLACAALVAAAVVGFGSVVEAVEAPPAGGGRGGGRGAQQPLPVGTPGGPIYIPPANQNISGVWWIQRYSPKLEIVGGGELPWTPAGLKKYQENQAALKAGTLKDEARRVCVPDGVPRILVNPYPFQVIQTPGQVTLVYELNHVIRPILLDKPLPPADELEIFPYYSGHSVGKWEGDTFVIESAGFNEKTFLDATGAPHSDQMRVVERWKRVNDKNLEVVATITDPAMLTRPVQVRYVYDLHPEVRLEDYNCGDPHRDIYHIPGVRRPQ